VTFVLYTEKNPDKAFFKPLPYIDASEAYNDVSGEEGAGGAQGSASPGATAKPGSSPVPAKPTPTKAPEAVGYKRKHAELNIDVPMVYQNPRFPTGCEPVAATMLLNYYGNNVTREKFVEKMPYGDYPYTGKYGKRYGPDPDKVFVGDPKDPGAWGIYAPGLKNTIDQFLADAGKSVVISDCTLDKLYEQIDRGNPVVVWATIDMKADFKGASWYIEGKKELFTWIREEHCLVLTGYDKSGNLLFNDPLRGKVKYSAAEFERAFNALGRQGIVVTRNQK
jgi:uncharacterized protein YvpB